MAILYTEAQVENAQLRAQVAMYLISQNIENGFYYLYSPVYQTYKALQYDIYTLFNVIGNEVPFVTFNPNPSTYESQFYDLVGSMINKIKQFDVYGQFGGAVNPNYQPPAGTIIVVTEPGFEPTFLPFTEADLVPDGFGGFYLPATGATGLVIVSVTTNGEGLVGWKPYYTFNPPQIWGFANNSAQVIVVTAI